MATLSVNQLALAPLGAGDLIDRAVRLYRRHFMTLIRIAAPPVILSAVGSVLWTLGLRGLIQTGSNTRLALYGLFVFAGFVLMVVGTLLNLIVIGGATRNLVSHLLWNEPVSARTTYRHVRARFWGLLGASILVSFCVGAASFIAVMAWYLTILVAVLGAFAFSRVGPEWLAAIFGGLFMLASAFGALWLFFLMAGRFAYVPQVMLVEGRSVFDAITRSFTLARGNIRRLMAVALFSTFATYSALMILVIPLGWFGYTQGIDPAPWASDKWPVWYAVLNSALSQSTYVLLAPVWIVGLSLLYVDERVRHEGYDIELLAARRLPPMPELAPTYGGHYNPALAAETQAAHAPTHQPPPGSVLGLG